MRARFVATDERVPPGALVVDSTLAGGLATYSHWKGSAEPPLELAADTATAILVKAAHDPGRWLTPFTWVCNDHIDTDGLLALAIACRPELGRDHGAILIGAAEASDFSVWTGEGPFRLMLRVHQHIRTLKATSTDWQQRICEEIPDVLPRLLVDATMPDPERDGAVRVVLQTRERLRACDGFTISTLPGLVSIAWTARLGLANDCWLAVDQAQDLPPWSMDAVGNHGDFRLLAMTVSGGTVFRLDAPGHSWARTVERRSVPWPDLAGVCAHLQEQEPGTCRWLSHPHTVPLGFVCQLASSTGDDQGTPQLSPSQLAHEEVRAACAQALRSPVAATL